MTKYDKNGSGRLEKDELKCFLTGINNGKECTDEQIDWVMREADIFGDGAVRTQAIIKATEAFRDHEGSKPREQAGSGCCTIG
jgi:Ca2+-binding EF-hand superfamily protein